MHHFSVPVDLCCWHTPLHSFCNDVQEIRENHAVDNKNVLGKHRFKCRQALSNARPSCPGRKEFSRADLVSWGLVVEMGTASSKQVNVLSMKMLSLHHFVRHICIFTMSVLLT